MAEKEKSVDFQTPRKRKTYFLSHSDKQHFIKIKDFGRQSSRKRVSLCLKHLSIFDNFLYKISVLKRK